MRLSILTAWPWPRPRLRMSTTTPPLFQSKILCLSLLYLLTTLPLSIYITFSPSSCAFNSPHILSSNTLFSYPSSYGEHRHKLPTPRSACSSPVSFPEYKVASREVEEICRNGSRPDSSALGYLERGRGGGGTFAGNFSVKERRSWFDYRRDDGSVEIPCGFLKEFPLSESDRLAMESCSGVVVASAVFGDHDKIRQPKGLGARTLETVCFFVFIDELTLRGLNRHDILSDKEKEEKTIGAWRVLILESKRLPYDNPAMNGVIPKHLLHRLFPNSKFSIWLDAKIQLTVDPLLLLHSLLISKDVDVAISKHQFNVHTMEEAMATARWKKWGDVESLRVQMETYCENGLEPWSPSKLPYTTDVPDTAVIVRRHSTASNLFSCFLFNELEAFNPRDQLAFAYVRDLMNPKIKMNMFEVEVFEQIAIEYRHNLRREEDGVTTMKMQMQMQKSRRASSRDINGSSCEHYLLKMWSETSD